MNIALSNQNVITGVVIAVFAAIFGAVLWRVFEPERLTYGGIFISSPEVFTRERLVNDRYEQDHWLMDELKSQLSCQATGTVNEERTSTLGAQIGEPSTSASPTIDSQGPEPAKANLAASAVVGQSVVPSPLNVNPHGADMPKANLAAPDLECFEDRLDYRDQLRTLRIENQLDDRHDLNGASLFRLKFDVAVVPGHNTTALAVVQVKIGPVPQSTSDDSVSAKRHNDPHELNLSAWEPIYYDWIDSVDRRLNQTQREQEQRYSNNNFSRENYLAFIYDLAQKQDLSGPEQVIGCEAMRMDLAKKHVLPLTPADHENYRKCILAIAQLELKEPIRGSICSELF
jgi:hypothetical protein